MGVAGVGGVAGAEGVSEGSAVVVAGVLAAAAEDVLIHDIRSLSLSCSVSREWKGDGCTHLPVAVDVAVGMLAQFVDTTFVAMAA